MNVKEPTVMERDGKTPQWVDRAWQGLTVLLLMLAALLWGGKYSEKLDRWGGWVRSALNYPVRSIIIPWTKSPDGKWELSGVHIQFTHQQKGYLIYIQKKEIVARRNGRAFLGGRNLVPELGLSLFGLRYLDFKGFPPKKADWLSDSLLKVENSLMLDGSSSGTTITLTVENRTGATIPYVITRYRNQTFFLFEIAAHSSTRFSFSCPFPERNRIGGSMGCMVGPNGKFKWDKYDPPHGPNWGDTYVSTITLRKEMDPEIKFAKTPAGNAP